MSASQWVQHLAVGAVFFLTAWALRSVCDHRGLLPHPRQQLLLGAALLLVENTVAVALVG